MDRAFSHAHDDIQNIIKEPQLSLAVIMIFQMLTLLTSEV